MSHDQPSDPALGLDGPRDPEHDPTASFVVEPSTTRRMVTDLVTTSGVTHTCTSPFTGAPTASLELSSSDDVAEAADRVRRAQSAWARTSTGDRAAVLGRLHDLLMSNVDDLLDLIQVESGKSRMSAYEEVQHLALTARYYARRTPRLLAPHRRSGVLPGLTRVDAHHHPKGLVGVISPWNYPLTMGLADGLAALAAGNAVLHKPDLQTPLSALRGRELLVEAGLPADAWQTVLGAGSELGPLLIDEVDHVCFTGSTRTGRGVATRAAERLIGASLELGGKNPMLVLRDADVKRAAEGAVRACFSNAGQLCVSMERLYVADQAYDAFVEEFVRRVSRLRLGTSLDYSTDMGSLINEAQLDTVTRHVEDARAKGATVLAGGRARPDVGPLFYEPTVLTDVDPAMECFADETFGPVVSIYRFADEADAVQRANEGTYGLNASVYTRDTARGRRVARQIACGTVNVNEGYAATFASIDATMGGMRRSGLGRRQGAEGLYRFTDEQSVATQRLIRFGSLPGLTGEQYQRVMGWGLTALKRLGRA